MYWQSAMIAGFAGTFFCKQLIAKLMSVHSLCCGVCFDLWHTDRPTTNKPATNQPTDGHGGNFLLIKLKQVKMIINALNNLCNDDIMG